MSSKTWWGEKFIEALTSFIDEGRLSRGKAYRNPSRLSEYTKQGNQVKATMKGNINPYFGVYKTPYYKTSIKFKPINNPESLIHDIASDPLVLAKLLTRELPLSIAKILPGSYEDMETKCSCPDWENPCKHLAGLYFKIAEEIDHNPLVIFELRGIAKDVISSTIKKYIKPTLEKEISLTCVPPENINLKSFWGVGQKLRKKQNVTSPISCVLIKKAGVNPPFWNKKKEFLLIMENIYSNIRRNWQKQNH